MFRRAPLLAAPSAPTRRALQAAVVVGVGVPALYVLAPHLFWRCVAAAADHVALPALRLLDAEAAHDLAIRAAALGLVPRDVVPDPPELAQEVWGLRFPNPLGLAAGFDKHAEGVDALLGSGFGFVEVGTVTPLPQVGNPKPRMFRLLGDRGIINRFGFNSHGMAVVRERLEARQHVRPPNGGLLGVNVGRNKTQEGAEDYIRGIEELGPYADYVVVNVSSPNTPGLRALQKRDAMAALVEAAQTARDRVLADADGRRRRANKAPGSLPLLIKIAPDLTDDEKRDIAEVALSTRVDGLVVTNTTVSRPETLRSPHKVEAGGLSGRPLRDLSTQVVREMYALTKGAVPIVGVGGVATGDDVLEKLKAGASLVQMYSMLVYEGPGAPRRVKQGLVEALRREGFASVASAVGADHRIPPAA